MPTNLVKTEHDEKLWSRAKAQAKAQGHAEDWAYVNSIYQSMKKESSYDPPLSNIPAHLRDDPAHSWRAESGIELLHQEPSLEEFMRILKNWKLMNDEQKRTSDAKSTELYGQDNLSRVEELLQRYMQKEGSPVPIKQGQRCYDQAMLDKDKVLSTALQKLGGIKISAFNRYGECITAAVKAIQENPNLKLVMGPPASNHPHDTHHFWTVTPDGKVYDPTSYLVPEGYRYEGKIVDIPKQMLKISALHTRRGHVRQEILRPIPNYSYMPVRITIQEHLADKRGLHWDLRIVTPRTAISFVIPRPSLDGEPGDRNAWIRMPDHRKAYADWSGTIPHGQYGGGTVKVVKTYNGVLNTKDGKFDLFYDNGKDYQKISITPGKDRKMHYAIHRSLPKEHHWQERPQYKALDTAKDYMMASEKLDGALVYAVLGENGITFTSRRKSTGGELIQKEHHVPWLRDTKVPKEYQGLVLAGELVHPKGFSFLTPILNSSPHNAVKLQHLYGRVQFKPHNVLNRSMTYKDKVDLLQDMSKRLDNKLISTPRYSNKPDDLWEDVKRKGGEGIVMFDPTSEDPMMYKKKLWQTHTGEVVSIDPGTGKYQDALGAMVVMDKDGNTVRVGGGQGLTDEMRREIFNNPSKYIGKKIRVISQGSTGKSLRQPRFHGWDLDERPLDSFGPGETIYNAANRNAVNSLN